MISVLKRVDRAIGTVELVFCVACLVVIVITTALAVIFRYGIGSPLVWTADTGVLALTWLTFVGAGLLLKEGRHVAAEGLVKRLPSSLYAVIVVVTGVVVVATVLLMGWFAVVAAQFQFAQKIQTLGLSRSFYSLPIVWAAASMGFTSVVHLLCLRGEAEA